MDAFLRLMLQKPFQRSVFIRVYLWPQFCFDTLLITPPLGWRRDGRGSPARHSSLALASRKPLGKRLDQVVEHWNEEHRDRRRPQHPADDAGAYGMLAVG